MIQMIVRVVAAGIVPDPVVAFRVNVRCIGMPGLFRVISSRLGRSLLTLWRGSLHLLRSGVALVRDGLRLWRRLMLLRG